MGEGKLAEFPARTILEVLFTNDPSALLSVTTAAARYDIVVGRSGIRYASRGQLGGDTAVFLLLMETEGTFSLGPVTSDNLSNCVFQTLTDVDARFAEWKKRLAGIDFRFLDPGRLYWWRSKLSKDVQQLAAPEYEVAQLTRDRAQTIDSLAAVLGQDVIEVAKVLTRMTHLNHLRSFRSSVHRVRGRIDVLWLRVMRCWPMPSGRTSVEESCRCSGTAMSCCTGERSLTRRMSWRPCS